MSKTKKRVEIAVLRDMDLAFEKPQKPLVGQVSEKGRG